MVVHLESVRSIVFMIYVQISGIVEYVVVFQAFLSFT